jgi:RNA polymerase primary sigma factor
MIGVIHAIEKYDYRKGFLFSTYASSWIKNYMSRGISNKARMIRTPCHAESKSYEVRNLIRKYQAQFNEEPSTEWLMKKTKFRKEVVEIAQANFRFLSLNQSPFDYNSGITFQDWLEDPTSWNHDQNIMEKQIFSILNQILSTLKPRERYILEQRFGLKKKEPRTLEDVGTDLDLTRERIRQLENVALKNLRAQLEGQKETLLSHYE